MNELFFELIRVAIGTQLSLSRQPSPKDWATLYDIAKKQSLVGVCFAGVQRLCNSETSDYCGMDEMLYPTWMGMTAKIQQKTQTVDERVALQTRLAADGVRSCILKGQGVGQLYAEHLLGLRQSGDYRHLCGLWPQERASSYCPRLCRAETSANLLCMTLSLETNNDIN